MIQNSKPDWLKIKVKPNVDFSRIKTILRQNNLSTVCEEAQCPNMAECWHEYGTATFMIMGDTCTRACRFCAVKTSANPPPLDKHEPHKLADAISKINLDYVVITSVDRDDLPDKGAGHFAECIRAIRSAYPKVIIEVLTPDFSGNEKLISQVAKADPNVFGHNIETVEQLQKIRDRRAGFEQSLSVLRIAKSLNPNIYTKSSLMLGLGETKAQVISAMKELRNVNCDILTLGQYLKPKNKTLEVQSYIRPEVFEEYKHIGEQMGFVFVASGPFVRSSYKAGELYIKNQLQKKRCKEDAQESTTQVSC